MNIPRPKEPATGLESSHGSMGTYVIGFVLSLALTMAAYVAVAQHLLSGTGLVAVVIGLAVTQLFVQLYFFLHLGRESKPRWNFIVFLFMLTVLVILVFGTLWIMQNLDYHTMQPSEVEQQVQDEEGIYR